MPAWTEEATVGSPTVENAALRPGSTRELLAVSGVPWVTLLFLLACAWVLLAAGGVRGALSVSGLLAYGAKATPLILDRGETWRLLSANLLHKDLLHLAFNAFAIWNVGGALERAVRPADYLALIIFTALGTTVASAVGADSISLGASGIAFGVLGASAAFGWRRAVRGRLRAHFGLRLLPWLFALFLAGLGSAGVDNWGHGGGLLAGAACGLFLTPRAWPGEAAARRLAAATGALLGTVSIGMFAAPALPVLGGAREGPVGSSVQVPLGWRKAASSPEQISYTNGLSTLWRSSVTLLSLPSCRGAADLVRAAVTRDLWRLADVGALRGVDVAEPQRGQAAGTVRAVATVLGEDGQAHLEMVCAERDRAALAVLVLRPLSERPTELAGRIARTVRWPVVPAGP
ncbi:MAG: rhomboid family intramembrane serine protease [Myxococcales bacterium]